MSDSPITQFITGHLRFDLAYIYKLSPGHPNHSDVVDVPIYCYHIALPERSVLVDAPVFNTDLISNALLIPNYTPPSPLTTQLANLGIEHDRITDVIITHCHFDHFNAITRLENGRYHPTFPNAQHYLGAADWQPDTFDELEETTLTIVNKAGQLTLINTETNIGDGLTIIPKPGETPGHQIVHLDQDHQQTYFTGDLYHHQIEFTDTNTNVFWAKPDKMNNSKQSFLEAVADTGSHIFFAHIPGPYQVIQTQGGYQWQPMTL